MQRAVRTFSLLGNLPLSVDLDLVSKPDSTLIRDWLFPSLDLSSFPYAYPTNGITEGLNYWLEEETRQIEVCRGEYQWVSGKDLGEVIYQSNPSAVDGNWKSIPTHKPVVLDCAYIGSTALQKVEIPGNVEKVFYSFSKSFGLRNIRTGWVFSKQPMLRLQSITFDAKYYNYVAENASRLVMDKFTLDAVYNTLVKYQLQVCKEYNFTPSDSVWLATTNDKKYDNYKRGNLNRVCIAEEIQNLYRKSI